jgi:DNA-binding protein YbaB
MSEKALNEFAADNGEVYDPVEAEGGPVQPRLADAPGVIAAAGAEIEAEEQAKKPAVNEAVAALFTDMEVNEEFVAKLSTVFEAAVNEASVARTAALEERVQAKLDAIQEQALTEEALNREALQESIDEVSTLAESKVSALEEQTEAQLREAADMFVENLDKYLSYVVEQWMEENAVAIEAGIKVERAESIMESIKAVLGQHNVQIDESAIDMNESLRKENETLKEQARQAMNEAVEMSLRLKKKEAESIFSDMTEGLTVSQVERLRILSERVDTSDLNTYRADLQTLKESFFGEATSKAPQVSMITEEATEILEEAAKPKSSAPDYILQMAEQIKKMKH